MFKHLFLSLFIPLSISAVFSQNICDELKNALKHGSLNPVQTRTKTMSIYKTDTTLSTIEKDTNDFEHHYEWRGGKMTEKIITELRTYFLHDLKNRYLGAPYNGWCYHELDTTKTKGRLIQHWTKEQSEAMAEFWYGQISNCQKQGEEAINGKNCTIYSYELRNHPDTVKKYTFVKGNQTSVMPVVTYFKVWIGNDGRIYQNEQWNDANDDFGTHFRRSTIEFDVPVKIDIPKGAYNFDDLIAIERRRDTLMKYLTYSRRPLKKSTSGMPIVKNPDQLPQYKEGEMALQKHIAEQVAMMRVADRFYQKPTTVDVSFTVETDGTLSHIVVNKAENQRKYVEAEAVRIVEMTSGHWQAAVKKGKKVCSVHKLSVHFFLKPKS